MNQLIINKTIDEIIAKQQKLDEEKAKQRAVTRDYLREVIATFGFTPADLFNNAKSKFRDGSVATCRAIYAANPNISRQEFMAQAADRGVLKATASTQYARVKKAFGSS